MIKNFNQFLNEKDGKDSMSEDAKISLVFQELDRNYNNFPTLSALKSSEIQILEERRDWKDPAKIAQLEKLVTEPGKFYIKYQKENAIIEVQMDFDLTFKGVENFDKPDDDYNYNMYEKRMGISLETLNLKKIAVKSDSVSYSSTNFSKDLGKTVLRFLLHLFQSQFDMIGDEALIIRQL